MKENSIKNSLSLCLYCFLKDCVTNCIKKYELFQQIKMFSETDTQTSWQTNFNICSVIIFVNKIGLGRRWCQNQGNITNRFRVVSAWSLFHPEVGTSMQESCASFLDAINGIIIPKRSSHAWKTHLFQYHTTILYVTTGLQEELKPAALPWASHISYWRSLLILLLQQLLVGTQDVLLR